jgi:hypothetical protein
MNRRLRDFVFHFLKILIVHCLKWSCCNRCSIIRTCSALQPLLGRGPPQKAPPFPNKSFLFLTARSTSAYQSHWRHFLFSLHKCFYQVRLSVSSHPSTWRSGAYLTAWVITFDLSGMGGPASSYATAGLVFRILWPRKAHHYIKVGIPSGEGGGEGGGGGSNITA